MFFFLFYLLRNYCIWCAPHRHMLPIVGPKIVLFPLLAFLCCFLEIAKQDKTSAGHRMSYRDRRPPYLLLAFHFGLKYGQTRFLDDPTMLPETPSESFLRDGSVLLSR